MEYSKDVVQIPQPQRLRAGGETAKIARVCKEAVEPLRRGKEKRPLFNEPRWSIDGTEQLSGRVSGPLR